MKTLVELCCLKIVDNEEYKKHYDPVELWEKTVDIHYDLPIPVKCANCWKISFNGDTHRWNGMAVETNSPFRYYSIFHLDSLICKECIDKIPKTVELGYRKFLIFDCVKCPHDTQSACVAANENFFKRKTPYLEEDWDDDNESLWILIIEADEIVSCKGWSLNKKLNGFDC
jgi:hypothetical protein